MAHVKKNVECMCCRTALWHLDGYPLPKSLCMHLQLGTAAPHSENKHSQQSTGTQQGNLQYWSAAQQKHCIQEGTKAHIPSVHPGIEMPGWFWLVLAHSSTSCWCSLQASAFWQLLHGGLLLLVLLALIVALCRQAHVRLHWIGWTRRSWHWQRTLCGCLDSSLCTSSAAVTACRLLSPGAGWRA